ncbi:MAG: galactose-1-epimerase [Flavobacteriaceae bacterium]|nr:MAG: galactose-1-epimerase [Flavobacteriaceae bacterium]
MSTPIKYFKRYVFVICILLISCSHKKHNSNRIDSISVQDKIESPHLKSKINPENFEAVIDGEKTRLFVLNNKNGLEATFTNFGQRLVSLMVPDKNGVFEDVVLGFSNLEGYQSARGNYFGAIIGRYSNRIANGEFSIDGVSYQLAVNNGGNHIHGGNKGFNNVVWKGEQQSNNEVEFTRISSNMEEGYPGNLNVRVNYKLTEDNELQINYYATTDKSTIVNLTNHSFFNLAGEGKGNVNNHLLTINADFFTPVNNNLIPTGVLENVEDTPFDFTIEKAIGRDLDLENEQFNYTKGYDHNFVLNNSPKNEQGLIFAAKVVEPKSGRVMEVYTNEPGIQFYESNFLDGVAIGKSGKPYVFRGAICLETQHFPNSPNQSNFLSTLLKPNQIYSSTTVYKFSTQN